MIKAVNKRTLEITLPESEYFEKAVIFLRTDIPVPDHSAARKARESLSMMESDAALMLGGKRRRRSLARIQFLTDILFKAAVIVCALAALAEAGLHL